MLKKTILFLMFFSFFSCKKEKIIQEPRVTKLSLDYKNDIIISLNDENHSYLLTYDLKKIDTILEKSNVYIELYDSHSISRKSIYGTIDKKNKTEVYLYKEDIKNSKKILETKEYISGIKFDPFDESKLYYLEAKTFEKNSPIGKKKLSNYLFVKYDIANTKKIFEKKLDEFIISGFSLINENNILFTSSHEPNFFILNIQKNTIEYLNLQIENIPVIFKNDKDMFISGFSFVNAEYDAEYDVFFGVTINRYLCRGNIKNKTLKVIHEFDTEAAMNQVIKLHLFQNERKILALQESGLITILDYEGNVLKKINLENIFSQTNRKLE